MSSRARLVAVLATIALLGTGCDWPMSRFGPSRAAFNGDDKISPANVAGLTEEWRASVGTSATPPVVAAGRAFVSGPPIPPASNGTLYAFDAAGATNCSGTPTVCAPLWSVSGKDVELSAPTVAAGNVFVGAERLTLFTYTSSLDAYHANDGTTAFHLGRGSRHEGVVSNDVLYAPVLDSVGTGPQRTFIPYVGAFDTKSGARKMAAFATASGWFNAPAVDGGVLFATTTDRLYAFDAAGVENCTMDDPGIGGPGPWCRPLWSANLGTYLTAPAVSSGRVYVGASTGKLFALNAHGCGAATCTPLWSAQLTMSALSDPAIAHDTVFAGASDGKLYALPAAGCGASTCVATWAATTGGAVTAPSVAGSLVYVGSADHHLYAYNAHGCGAATCSSLFNVDTGASVDVPVVISGDHVFVRDAGGSLHVYALPPKP